MHAQCLRSLHAFWQQCGHSRLETRTAIPRCPRTVSLYDRRARRTRAHAHDGRDAASNDGDVIATQLYGLARPSDDDDSTQPPRLFFSPTSFGALAADERPHHEALLLRFSFACNGMQPSIPSSAASNSLRSAGIKILNAAPSCRTVHRALGVGHKKKMGVRRTTYTIKGTSLLSRVTGTRLDSL